MILEFLKTGYGWDEGYETEVLEEDDEYYYFEDERHYYNSIEKSLEGSEFITK